MRRAVVPDPTRTLWLIGDQHMGKTAQARFDKVLQDTGGNGEAPAGWLPNLERLALTVSIGDSTDGSEGGAFANSTQEWADWYAWWNQLPPIAAGQPGLIIAGNHDLHSDTYTDWMARVGRAQANLKVDLGFCWVLSPAIEYVVETPTSALTWLAAQGAAADAAGVDVVVCSHAPLYDTYLTEDPDQISTIEPDGFWATTEDGVAHSASLLAVFDAHESFKVYASGHVHPDLRNFDYPGVDYNKIITLAGGRGLLHLTVPALANVGGVYGSTDPIWSTFLTRESDAWVVRTRNHTMSHPDSPDMTGRVVVAFTHADIEDPPPPWAPTLNAADDVLLTDSPALFWDGEVVGSKIKDASGHSRDGSPKHNAVLAQSVGVFVGDQDRWIDLDGDDDSVESAYSPFTANSARTIEAWLIRRDDTTFGNPLASTGGSGVGAYLRIQANGDVKWTSKDGASSITWAAAAPAVGVKFHVAVVVDQPNSQVSLYINGALVSTQAYSQAYDVAVGQFKVGATGATSAPWKGQLAKVAVFAAALSGVRIAAHYAAYVALEPVDPAGESGGTP